MTTLYLKYRPQNLEQLDLTHVRESLEKIVSSGKVPHAFLFSGPKGTGKTSAARILAKILNCEKPKGKYTPCNKCEQCVSITKGTNIDVIEIDAASHRGIDDVRALREAVKLATASANKKVYIIDEAHMLTKEASNALLKTLEEPPDHVVFILATTDPDKLIGTIRSRTTNINFKKASKEEIVRCLRRHTRGEKLKADKKSLEIIADSSDGSFRDAVKILEQLTSQKIKLTKPEKVEEYLSKNVGSYSERLLGFIIEKETKKALDEIEKSMQDGVAISDLTKSVIETLRFSMLAKVGMGKDPLEGVGKDDLIELIEILNKTARDLPSSLLEQLPLEIAVVKWCDREDGGNSRIQKESSKKETANNKKGNGASKLRMKEEPTSAQGPGEVKEDNHGLDNGVDDKKSSNGVSEEVDDGAVGLEEKYWAKIISGVRPKNTSTEALLRAAKPLKFDGKVLTIGVYYSFHKERLEEIAHRRLLEDVTTAVMGVPVRVSCTLTKPPRKANVTENLNTNRSKDSYYQQTSTNRNTNSGSGVLAESGDEDIIKVAKKIFGS